MISIEFSQSTANHKLPNLIEYLVLNKSLPIDSGHKILDIGGQFDLSEVISHSEHIEKHTGSINPAKAGCEIKQFLFWLPDSATAIRVNSEPIVS